MQLLRQHSMPASERWTQNAPTPLAPSAVDPNIRWPTTRTSMLDVERSTLNVLLLQANWLDSEGRKAAENDFAGRQASWF